MTLWDKGYRVDAAVLRFCTGEDPELDRRLVRFDCLGSLAHVRMLTEVGLLTPADLRRLIPAYRGILQEAARGKFRIAPAQEDVHTAIEARLTRRLGALGEKVHAGRSRNDQVMTAVRLYLREALLDLGSGTLDVATRMLGLARRHARTPMPGTTHTRPAMLSSVGHWAGAAAESLIDDMAVIEAAWVLADRSPLGSAAGFGTPLPVRRESTAQSLGFSRVQRNTLAVQNSRLKVEGETLHAAGVVLSDLARWAGDVIVYSAPENGYLTLPARFCTGSSIMPNKRNPDPFELVRASHAYVLGAEVTLRMIGAGLSSGYHRDFQLAKGPLLRGLEQALGAVRIAAILAGGLGVDPRRCRAACRPEILATDRACALVEQGIPFREAYRRAAAEPDGPAPKPAELRRLLARRRQTGAPGRLDLASAALDARAARRRLQGRRRRWEKVCAALPRAS